MKESFKEREPEVNIKETSWEEEAENVIKVIAVDEFGANRFTLEELQKKLFEIPEKDFYVPIRSNQVLSLVTRLKNEGFLGYDEKTDTYFLKESA